MKQILLKIVFPLSLSPYSKLTLAPEFSLDIDFFVLMKYLIEDFVEECGRGKMGESGETFCFLNRIYH